VLAPRTPFERNRDHANEFWERYELGYDALGAENQGRAKGDEIARHMRREQPLQADETRGIDEAAVEGSLHLIILPLARIKYTARARLPLIIFMREFDRV
jgi:hypothetical protein